MIRVVRVGEPMDKIRIIGCYIGESGDEDEYLVVYPKESTCKLLPLKTIKDLNYISNGRLEDVQQISSLDKIVFKNIEDNLLPTLSKSLLDTQTDIPVCMVEGVGVGATDCTVKINNSKKVVKIADLKYAVNHGLVRIGNGYIDTVGHLVINKAVSVIGILKGTERNRIIRVLFPNFTVRDVKESVLIQQLQKGAVKIFNGKIMGSTICAKNGVFPLIVPAKPPSSFSAGTKTLPLKVSENVIPASSYLTEKYREVLKDYTFEVIAGGKIKITDWEGTQNGVSMHGGVLKIPSCVSVIGERAFSGEKRISGHYFTGVEIAEGVEQIGREAFEENEELEYIKFPRSLKRLDAYAFAYCKNIERVEGDLSGVALETHNPFESCEFQSNTLSFVFPCYALGVSGEQVVSGYCAKIGGMIVSVPDKYGYFKINTDAETVYFTSRTRKTNEWYSVYVLDKGVKRVILPVNSCSGKSAEKGTRGANAIYIPESVTEIYRASQENAETRIPEEKFKLYGRKGSYVEGYAKENGYPFIALDEDFEYTVGACGICLTKYIGDKNTVRLPAVFNSVAPRAFPVNVTGVEIEKMYAKNVPDSKECAVENPYRCLRIDMEAVEGTNCRVRQIYV